jgi:hypothetical protein
MRPIFLHELDSHEGQLVSRLLDLPHKILSYDDLDGIQQLVLYELAHDESFGLSKASYLVDNPEFNCLKGVAGYDKNECASAGKNPWEDPKSFIDSMKQGKFHQQISSFMHSSLARNGQADFETDAIAQLGKKIGMENSSFVTWPMRHGNHGILLFEEGELPQERRRELLQHFVALLGLC